MPKLTIDVDLDSKKVVQRLEEAIEEGIEEAGDSIAEEGKEKARHKIVEEGALFRGELFASFETEVAEVDGDTVVKIRNTADHAAPVNDGRKPNRRAPPLHKLLPWVREHLPHWYPEDRDYADNVADYFRKNSSASLSVWTDLEIWRAYELQQEIKVHGIDAVRFMEFAEEWLERHGSFVVRNKIGEEFFRRGLK